MIQLSLKIIWVRHNKIVDLVLVSLSPYLKIWLVIRHDKVLMGSIETLWKQFGENEVKRNFYASNPFTLAISSMVL